MRMPSAEDRLADLWAMYASEHPEMVSYPGDEAVFSPGTPQEVLDSYELWRSFMRDEGLLR